MPTQIPPIVPPQAAAGQDPPEAARVHFRVQQVLLSIIAVVFTVWLWRIHPIAGIVAAFLTKHLLVAILASGLAYPDPQPPK